MKCEWPNCTKKAKLKISTSGRGETHCYCNRHSFMYVKQQMMILGRYDFGIYIQRPPEQTPPREISPEARHAVSLPEDRAKKKEVMERVFANLKEDDEWEGL